MWLYWVEIKHYSALVKNELTVVIKALGFPLHHALVPTLFGASTSRSIIRRSLVFIALQHSARFEYGLRL